MITYTSTLGYLENSSVFTENDDWYWGGGYGKCENAPDLLGKSSDAAQEINKKLQLVFKPVTFTSGFFTEIEYRTFDNSDNYLSSNGENLYYRHEGLLGYYPCINDYYMNFYYNGVIYAINNPKYYDMAPTGKTRLNIIHQAMGYQSGQNQSNQIKIHYTKVKYGKPIQLIEPRQKLSDFVL